MWHVQLVASCFGEGIEKPRPDNKVVKMEKRIGTLACNSES
jgi:hypothetical protein